MRGRKWEVGKDVTKSYHFLGFFDFKIPVEFFRSE